MINKLDLFFHPNNFFLKVKRNKAVPWLYLLILLTVVGFSHLGMIYFQIYNAPNSSVGITFIYIKKSTFFEKSVFILRTLITNSMINLSFLLIVVLIFKIILYFYKIKFSFMDIISIAIFGITPSVLATLFIYLLMLSSFVSHSFAEFTVQFQSLVELIYYGLFYYSFFLIREGILAYHNK